MDKNKKKSQHIKTTFLSAGLVVFRSPGLLVPGPLIYLSPDLLKADC